MADSALCTRGPFAPAAELRIATGAERPRNDSAARRWGVEDAAPYRGDLSGSL